MVSHFERTKRFLSGDSPKEGQKESKKTKIGTIPLTEITEAEQKPYGGDLPSTF